VPRPGFVVFNGAQAFAIMTKIVRLPAGRHGAAPSSAGNLQDAKSGEMPGWPFHRLRSPF
jgi:hypothetical protein